VDVRQDLIAGDRNFIIDLRAAARAEELPEADIVIDKA
jgi:hypothetical protein